MFKAFLSLSGFQVHMPLNASGFNPFQPDYGTVQNKRYSYGTIFTQHKLNMIPVSARI